MFEKALALRYIRAQKRHSIFTVSCIAAALALITLLFTGYSTYRHIIRESAYIDKPYHLKIMQLTEQEYTQLAENDELECRRVDEQNGTVSAEIMLKDYHEDVGMYVNSLFPEKYLYSDRYEEFRTDLIDVNAKLIECDRRDLWGKYDAAGKFAAYSFFILVLVIALRLMIDTAFEVSSKERERQFGMLQCMGAEPAQIVRVIIFEGLFLSIFGVPLGLLLGTALSFAAFAAVSAGGIAEVFFTEEKAAQIMHLYIDPRLVALSALTGIVWVLLSAYQTGVRVVKMSPIEAVNGRSGKIEKVRRDSLFGRLFGWKGKLAARNNRRQPKRFIITVVSLTLSVTLFASFTIVLGRSLSFLEKTVELLGLNYDMGVGLVTDSSDQLSYRKGLDMIEESGYFEIEDFSKAQTAYAYDEMGNAHLCRLMYYPRETFAEQFEEGLPITYDELTELNAYIAMEQTDDSIKTERYEDMGMLPVSVEDRILVSDEEFEKMSDEEKKNVTEFIAEDYATGEKALKYRFIAEYSPANLTIAGIAHKRSSDDDVIPDSNEAANALVFVGTLDEYENGAYNYAVHGSTVNTEGLEYVHLNLKNKNDYEIAKSFIASNPDVMMLDEDYYGDMQKMSSAVGALRIGMAFISILIGIIALVNMFNILSTGILNRRAEFAAMQCLGMTEGQLKGMTVIECLQYALTAGVLSTLIIEGLMFAMVFFLKRMGLYDIYGDLLDFVEPLPRVWLSSAAAFAAAVAATLTTLRLMRSDSLTEQIRNIE